MGALDGVNHHNSGLEVGARDVEGDTDGVDVGLILGEIDACPDIPVAEIHARISRWHFPKA